MPNDAEYENELYQFVRDHPMVIGALAGSLGVLTYYAVVGLS